MWPHILYILIYINEASNKYIIDYSWKLCACVYIYFSRHNPLHPNRSYNLYNLRNSNIHLPTLNKLLQSLHTQ